MTVLDPAQWQPSTRALGAFAAIAAGTAVSVATGGATVAVAAASALASYFTNHLAGDISKLWDDRRRDPKYTHPNHDLTKLVGDSIAHVLHAAADDAAEDSALKIHAAWLRSLAKIASRSFVKIAARDFAEIASDQLPEIFSRAATSDGGEFPLLTEEVWTWLIEHLRGEAKVKQNPVATPFAAARLHQRLFSAVREMFKRDFSADGRAYAALCLDMNALLLSKITLVFDSQQSMRAELRALSEDLRRRHEAFRTALTPEQAQGLSWLIVEVRVIGEQIENLLAVAIETKKNTKKILDGKANLATKDDLKAIEERILRELADKVPGQDPRDREFPPELIEQAKLLRARGDKEQQATAEIALRSHTRADSLIQELKREPLQETFRLLMLEGHNWYQAGEFDRAIVPYEQALALRSTDFGARNNVAIAHASARLGDIGVHQRLAMAHLEQSLTLLPTHSVNWALTQNNLGEVSRRMPTGDRAENVRRAIAAFEAALTVRTKDAHPVNYAATQNNLGNACQTMPTGNRGANLRKAITAYEAALTVYTREAHPVYWATTQNNLGVAWQDMPTPDRGANLRKAIAAYEAALTVYTQKAHPANWAMTQNNLGIAWQNMPIGDRGANLRTAIAAYEAALTVCTREAHPVAWATIQNNLGSVWQDMATGDRGVNLQNAIAAYEAALTVHTREAHPFDWAMTQYNLAIALTDLASASAENRCSLLRQAIASGKGALTVRTATSFPNDHANTLNNLEIHRKAYEAAGCSAAVPFDAIEPAI